MLLFAVDAKGDVHWLFPAYEREGEDPPSMELRPSSREALLPTSVVLDSPVPGPMRLIALVTESALRVSAIEKREARFLSLQALASTWPKAAIQEVPITVEAEK